MARIAFVILISAALFITVDAAPQNHASSGIVSAPSFFELQARVSSNSRFVQEIALRQLRSRLALLLRKKREQACCRPTACCRPN
jgi:hypothetical protein